MEKCKVGFVSLGCPKNQVDTEIMIKHVYDAGYEIVNEDIDADIMVINTCAFIESAKQEAIDTILDIAWLKENRNLKGIVVTGCLSERYKSEILKELPEVDAVLGCGGIHQIVDAIKSVQEGKRYEDYPDKEKYDLGGERIITSPSYYAYLKIAEGCDNNCTYCAIPKIKGKFRSRPPEEIIKEAKELEELGAKELIIVAQDTAAYGKDFSYEFTLSKLLCGILDNTKMVKIRILYVYPEKITDELIDTIKNNERIIKYIDLPIQHISDKILRKMNRRGGSSAIYCAIDKLRAEIPNIIIRTTLITGFPGEGKEEFDELLKFVCDYKFERLGVFPYSREEGTPAFNFDGQVEESEKQERADKIMEAQMMISQMFNEKQIGKVFSVICEGYDKVSESYYGMTYMDAPEIDGKIYFSSNKKLEEGQVVDVEVTDILDYDLIGEAI